jgi:hypothetical protein
MKISLQKLLLVILFKSLFLSCIAKNLKSSNIFPNLNEKKNLVKENKVNLSLIEKKSETKTTPVKIFFKKRLDHHLIFIKPTTYQNYQTNQ